MKKSKHLFLSAIVSVGLLFGGMSTSVAAISNVTQTQLNQKDFRAAKSSIEKDLKADKYDAKAWYFYSRILYQLDQPNAAKKALNNAMNINKTGSFAKGGMSNIRSFASDITAKINSVQGEVPVNMPRITGAEYDKYLASVFGSNTSFSNVNPPSAEQIQLALSNKRAAVTQNKVIEPPKIVSNNVVPNAQNSVVPKPSVPTVKDESAKYDPMKTEKASVNEDSGFSFWPVFLIFMVLPILLICLFAFNYFNGRRVKNLLDAENAKKEEARKSLIVSLFNKMNAICEQLEEKEKDYKALIPNTELLNFVSETYTRALNYLKSIDLNDTSVKNEKNINEQIDFFANLISTIEKAYSEKDFDLTNLLREQEEKLQAKNKADEQARIQREIEAKRKREHDAEMAKKRAREQKLQREHEEKLQRERELQRQREIEAERLRQSRYHNSSQDRNYGSNGGSRINDMVVGAAAYHLADSVLGNSNHDDNNDSLWGSKSSQDDNNDSLWRSKSSQDDNNDSLWGSTSSQDDNDSLWDSNDNSGSSDDSNNW